MSDPNDTAGVQMAVDRLLGLGRMAYSQLPAELNLSRSQWAALHYFARANELSRTASAFCQFYGTTAGTVSQSIKSLVSRGLIRKHPSADDKRSLGIELTDAGWKALEHDPAWQLIRAVSSLNEEQAGLLAESLEAMVLKVARESDRPAFGSCRACRHLQREKGADADGGAMRCSLMNAPVSPGQADLICVSYESD